MTLSNENTRVKIQFYARHLYEKMVWSEDLFRQHAHFVFICRTLNLESAVRRGVGPHQQVGLRALQDAAHAEKLGEAAPGLRGARSHAPRPRGRGGW